MLGNPRLIVCIGMSMQFTKMQGVGNDFVVMEDAALPQTSFLPDLAIRTCDRHFGIGADGLLVVSRDAPGSAFRMRMFNPDGTEDMCGNGLRCVSLWASRAGWLSGQTEFTVAVKGGTRKVRLMETAEEGRAALIGVEMGVPQFESEHLPFRAALGQRVLGYPLAVDGVVYLITSVNTGSTHTVIFGEAPTEEVFRRVSPQIETHPLYPERTSVLWATPFGDNGFQVRIWERGVGETLGCGTGACAVGAAAVVSGLSTAGEPISIISRGGTLQITWPGEDKPLDMVGPAHWIYTGEFGL
jgi:diaminopimelate epimerase